MTHTSMPKRVISREARLARHAAAGRGGRSEAAGGPKAAPSHTPGDARAGAGALTTAVLLLSSLREGISWQRG